MMAHNRCLSPWPDIVDMGCFGRWCYLRAPRDELAPCGQQLLRARNVAIMITHNAQNAPGIGTGQLLANAATFFQQQNMSACRIRCWQEGQMGKFDNRFLGVGIAVGVGVGIATDNLAIGLAIGIALGLAIGRWRKPEA